MQRKKYLATLVTALIIVMATLTWASSAAASSYKILHRFSVYSSPQGNLIFDAAGNLYGTTQLGGTGGGGERGVVFKLAP